MKVERIQMHVIARFQKASPAAKASIALLLSNLILKGLSMISGPIFTRIMSTDQYGMVSNFTTWQGLLGTIITLNLAAGVFNNGMLEFKEDRDSFQASLVLISTTTAFIFLGGYFLFPNQFCEFLDIDNSLCFLMFVYFLFTPVYGYWSARQRYEFRYKMLFLLSIGTAVISLIASVIAVLMAPAARAATAKIVASELPNIILGAFFYIYIVYKSKLKINFRYISYALKFNLPLIPHYLSMYVLASSDRVMITKLVSNTATAIYSVSYTVGMVINIFWQSIDASIAPWIYERMSTNDKEDIRRRTFQILAIIMVACVLSCLFAPEIIWILAPKEYYSGIYVIPSIAASSFFIAAYSIYMRIELYYKKTVFAMTATTLAAMLNLILNYFFIEKYGFIAAGYTTLVCYLFLTLFHYLNVRKQGFDDYIDNKRILLLSVLVVLCSFGINFLYGIPALRWITIIILLIVCFVKRNIIFQAIKK